MNHLIRYSILLLLFLAACQPESLSTTDSVGEAVYVQQCASCHGVNLEGQPDWKIQNEDGSFRAPPHDDSGHTWHHGDPTLLEAIRLGGARFNDLNIGGTSPMPAYGEILSDEEITAILIYIKSNWTEENQAWQQEATIREQAQTQ
jgi:mono/diheme cytochrome c family protein